MTTKTVHLVESAQERVEIIIGNTGEDGCRGLGRRDVPTIVLDFRVFELCGHWRRPLGLLRRQFDRGCKSRVVVCLADDILYDGVRRRDGALVVARSVGGHGRRNSGLNFIGERVVHDVENRVRGSSMVRVGRGVR